MITYTLSQRIYKILKIALPSGGYSLLDVANISIGMYFIAHFSNDALAAKENIVALSVGMSFWMFLFSITAIISVGTTAQVSRAFGEKNKQSVANILSTMSLFSILLSLPVMLLAIFSISPYLDFMHITGNTKHLGESYLWWLCLSIPVLFLKSIFIASLSAVGDTTTIFFIKIFTTFINVALNYALIYGIPQLNIESFGILGAAFANIITSYIEGIVLCVILFKWHKYLHFSKNFTLKTIKNAIYTGFPTGIERGLTILSLTLILRFMSKYGLDAIAGFQIGSRLESIIFMPGFGFQVAAMALMGQMIGRKRLDLASDFIRANLLISCIIMGFLGLIMCVFGVELSKIFNEDSKVVAYSFWYLVAVGISQVPLICIFVLDGAFRGAGATKLSLLINMSSIWLLRIIPMSLCVHFSLSAYSIYAIICIETFIRAGIFIFIFKKNIWHRFIARF